MNRPLLKCALLGVTYTNWFEDMLFACPDLALYTLQPDIVGIPGVANPYELRPAGEVDVVIIGTNWYRWLEATHSGAEDHVFERLRAVSHAIVGFEGWDTFDLGFPPAGIDRVDLLIKSQGIYKDLGRYNVSGGPKYPRSVRTASLQPPFRYTPRQLGKLRLSVPCFLGVERRVRAKARHGKPYISRTARQARWLGDTLLEGAISLRARGQRPRSLAHCVVGLTHISRLDLVRLLKALNVSGSQCVTHIPERTFGTAYLDEPVPAPIRAGWQSELRELEALCEQRPRGGFRASMCAHRCVIAPTGYGELTFRHAEGWLSGRPVICPSVSHAEIMYPFRDGHNVFFCSPDWSNLPEILGTLEQDSDLARAVGAAGRRDWIEWSDGYREQLRTGIVSHLLEALGSTADTIDVEGMDVSA